MATRRKKANTKTGLVEEVNIVATASFTRHGKPTMSDGLSAGDNYNYVMRGMALQPNGDLTAGAGCSDDVFVCNNNEIPQLIQFLQKIVDGQAEAKKLV